MSVLPFFFERLRKNVFIDLEQCLAPGASRSEAHRMWVT